MDHQKPTVLLIFGTLSLGGCGGHPMRPKLNLKDKAQISRPNELLLLLFRIYFLICKVTEVIRNLLVVTSV